MSVRLSDKIEEIPEVNSPNADMVLKYERESEALAKRGAEEWTDPRISYRNPNISNDLS